MGGRDLRKQSLRESPLTRLEKNVPRMGKMADIKVANKESYELAESVGCASRGTGSAGCSWCNCCVGRVSASRFSVW